MGDFPPEWKLSADIPCIGLSNWSFLVNITNLAMSIEEARAVAQELRQGKTLSIDNFEACEYSVFGYHADSLQYYMERVNTLVGRYHKLDFYDGESAFLSLLQDFDKTDLE